MHASASTLNATTTPPPPQTTQKSGALGAGVGIVPPAAAGEPPQSLEQGTTDCLKVNVGQNATALVAELSWNDTLQHMILYTISSDGATANYDGASNLQQSPLQLTVPNPAPGAWQVCAKANGVDANLTYTLYGTVFHTPVPAGFTARPH